MPIFNDQSFDNTLTNDSVIKLTAGPVCIVLLSKYHLS